jgi:hypothetical protein
VVPINVLGYDHCCRLPDVLGVSFWLLIPPGNNLGLTSPGVCGLTMGNRWATLVSSQSVLMGRKLRTRLQPKLCDVVTLQQHSIDIRPLGGRPMAHWGRAIESCAVAAWANQHHVDDIACAIE